MGCVRTKAKIISHSTNDIAHLPQSKLSIVADINIGPAQFVNRAKGCFISNYTVEYEIGSGIL